MHQIDAMHRVDIVLGTFNGAMFLNEQLDSIAAQTHRNWRLIVRDDGSTDCTLETLQAFRDRHPDRVLVLRDDKGNLGLNQNFSCLLEQTTARYVALCDQDDVWHPDKLALSLEKMRLMELEHGAGVPLLVFSDLTVVDENLRVLHQSFWRYQGLRPERCRVLRRLLVQNVVGGPTALANLPLIQKSVPIPVETHAHDWWLAMVAATFGFSDYVEQPTVLYRQHGRNTFGARPLTLTTLPRLVKQFVTQRKAFRRRMLARFDQADVFSKRYGAAFRYEDKMLFQLITTLPDKNVLRRIYLSVRYRVLPYGWIRAAFFVLFCHR